MQCLRPFAHLVFFFCLNFHGYFAADRVTLTEPLSGDQTIVSGKGEFEMGFFRPGKSLNYYVGIWYNLNRVSELTVVWVGNREIPVSGKYSSELRIANGNLVLFNEQNIPVWSTNVSSSAHNVEAVLLDDGNLVLNNTNGNNLQWQSFDNPTHTFLPGAKVGLNKITGKNTRLISWKNKEDPTPGLFSLELDPNGTSQFYVMLNDSQIYWSSGTWNGQIFSLVPEMRLNYIYNLSYFSNVTESYFTYSMYNSSIISRFVIDVGGQIQQSSWLEPSNSWAFFWSQPKVACEVYAYCGPFGVCNGTSPPFCQCLTGFKPKSSREWLFQVYSGGCVGKTSLPCGNPGRRDKFLVSHNIELGMKPLNVSVESAEECESNCLTNCSCSAYGYDNNQCSIWLGNLLDLRQRADGDPYGRTLHIKLAASKIPSTKSNNTGVIIGAVFGSAVSVFLIVILVYVILIRKRTVQSSKAVEGGLIAFGYRDLTQATKNFSEKLGGGGFGSVFKGTLPDSSAIAVKKLESISQGEKQFRTEVSTIGTVQHVNLVRLRGFCAEGTKKLLVYDYMPNGSLDFHLFHAEETKVLDWKTRYNIALGTARGLTYLHEKCRDCIIHCDIKPENILLDAEFCPKVADFGLAKLVGRDFSRVLTTMRGTRGYLAPEWISGVAITIKADVYSYGMMLFEIVSGRRNSEQSVDGTVKFFPTWVARRLTEGGDLIGLLDPWLETNADPDELTRVCKVACWCIQDEETQRPTMGQVVQILEGVLSVNLPPIPRSLQVFTDNQENIVFFTESSSSQSSQSQAQSNASNASSQAKSNTSSMSSKSRKGEPNSV